MIVKENLLLGYSNHNNTDNLLEDTTSAIAPIKKGEKYTISYIVENSNRFGVYTDTLSDGIFEPYTDMKGNRDCFETKKGDNINYTFTADKDGYVIVYLSNVSGDVKETDFKIEEGDKKTPYIPSKNMLEPSKQPLLPPEGNFKEIQSI